MGQQHRGTVPPRTLGGGWRGDGEHRLGRARAAEEEDAGLPAVMPRWQGSVATKPHGGSVGSCKAGQEVRNFSAAIRDRAGPGRPFPPGAMMSGCREAGSPTQPASLSSSAFPVGFCEQCVPCRGHGEAGPPALPAAPGGLLAPTPASRPLLHAACCSPGTRAAGGCWRRTFCPGDLGCLPHRCEVWREENAACVGRSPHPPGTAVLRRRQGCRCASSHGTSGPGKTHVRGRQAGEPRRKPLEKGRPCQPGPLPLPGSIPASSIQPCLPGCPDLPSGSGNSDYSSVLRESSGRLRCSVMLRDAEEPLQAGILPGRGQP